MNKSSFAGLIILLSAVMASMMTVQTVSARFPTVGGGDSGFSTVGSMFGGGEKKQDECGFFGCSPGSMFGGGEKKQEPQRYPPPTYNGEPVCTIDRPCSVETQEDAEYVIREHPGAIVTIDPSISDEYEEQSGNDEEEETDEEDNGDGGDSDNEENAVTEGGGAPQPLNQQPAQQGGGDTSGQGLFDACLQTPGMTPQKCNNYLGSSDVGNYCTTLTIAGVPCPEIQNPEDTYSDPEGSLAESQQKIEQTENAIEGFNRLYPPGSLGGEFAGPGSTTNRPGQ